LKIAVANCVFAVEVDKKTAKTDRKNGCVNQTYLCGDHLDGKKQSCGVGIVSAPSLGLYSQHFVLSVTYVWANKLECLFLAGLSCIV
jgi:hypothetical protein